jgi:5-methylcytosine-specific restriction endonuclease McrA
METKVCSSCKEIKQLNEFYKSRSSSDGYQNECKLCDKLRKKNKRVDDEVFRTKVSTYNKQYSKAQYAANPSKYREASKQYYLNNKPKCFIKRDRRRVMASLAPGCYLASHVVLLQNAQHAQCVYCRVSIKDAQHIDHIMPLSKGGCNWPQNLQILCPTCNFKKGAKHPDSFEEEIGFDRAAYEEKFPRPTFGD